MGIVNYYSLKSRTFTICCMISELTQYVGVLPSDRLVQEEKMSIVEDYVSSGNKYVHYRAQATQGIFSELKIVVSSSADSPFEFCGSQDPQWTHIGQMTHENYTSLSAWMAKRGVGSAYNRVAMAIGQLAHPQQ